MPDQVTKRTRRPGKVSFRVIEDANNVPHLIEKDGTVHRFNEIPRKVAIKLAKELLDEKSYTSIHVVMLAAHVFFGNTNA